MADSLRADFVLAWRRLRTSKVPPVRRFCRWLWHRSMPRCVSTHRRTPAAAVADRGPGSPLRALSPGIPEQRPAHYARDLGVPAIPGDASRRCESGHPDRHLERRTRGNQLALRWRNRKSARAIRFRRYVRDLRTPRRLRSPALAKRRPPDWRPSGCRLVTRLLVPAFCPGSANHRANFPPRQ